MSLEINPEQYRILLVDDTEANVRLLSHVLTKEGYEVEIARNGTEALKATRSYKPDLILLDVMMPDKSGFQVSSELKDSVETSDIPIIFLSALSDSDVKVKGFKSGGVDYITKPFKKEETLARINTHLYMRSLQRSLNDRINALKEREIELSQLNRQKDTLVRMVSHDIKNPLTGILGLVKLMKTDQENSFTEEQRKHMFSVIEESGNKLLKLVTEVLDKDAKSTESETLNKEKTSLDHLTKQVFQLNNAKALVKDIELKLKNEADEDWVSVDSGKLEIVLNNLVSNALKFTPSGGEILIEITQPDSEHIQFEVRDNGIGINEKEQDNLLTANSRTSTIGTNGEIGIGLGLDIVQHYVDLHHGTIRVKSAEGVGTSFFITLPIN